MSGAGWGGRRAGAGPAGNTHAMSHGIVLLERILKQGLDERHPIGLLLQERTGRYIADLGGEESISSMELGLCERLAKLDLFEALLDARLIDPATGKTRRLSWPRLHSLGLLRVRLTDSYTRTASALGLRRREKRIDLAQAFAAAARLPDEEASG